MSDLSMAAQRLRVVQRRCLQLFTQLSETHPDSPEADLLHEELLELERELEKLNPIVLAELPWYMKALIVVVRTVAEMLNPLYRAGHRLYHMAKGLM